MPTANHPADPILSALSTEVRRDVLRLIEADGPLSPKTAAQTIGLPLPNTAYHFKVLREAGLIELSRTEPRRGAVEHFYKRARKNAARIDEILGLADKLR